MNIIDEKNYVDTAEAAINRLRNKKNPRNGKPEAMVTTSKIRNLLSMTSDIYNEVMIIQGDELNEEIISRIQYLRVRFLYEAGRDDSVRNFVEEGKLLDILKEIGTSKKNYVLYSRYMEALIAYHKFYRGKD